MDEGLTEVFMKQLNVERNKVDVANHDFSVRELVRMMSDDELNVAPSYQRQFRWEPADESLFIESVFLGLPIPPIFVATNVGFQWEVVDGLQRLSSLAHFLAETSSAAESVGRSAPLRLDGLEKLSGLNSSTFLELPKSIRVFFGRQPLQVISLTDKSNLDVRFDVFERLNRGGVKLSAQEVRACVYRGAFNDFVDRLSTDAHFKALLKLQKGHQNDGTVAEQVLKFFAYKNFRDKYDGRVEQFLNKSMSRAEESFDYATEEKVFRTTSEMLHEICNGAFLATGGKGTTPLVRFEASMVGIAELLAEGTPITAPSGDWINDSELKASSGAGNNTRPLLARRIQRARELFSGLS